MVSPRGDPTKPKPRTKIPNNPLSEDNVRHIIKGKTYYLIVLHRNQGPQPLVTCILMACNDFLDAVMVVQRCRHAMFTFYLFTVVGASKQMTWWGSWTGNGTQRLLAQAVRR